MEGALQSLGGSGGGAGLGPCRCWDWAGDSGTALTAGACVECDEAADPPHTSAVGVVSFL